jgi:hypothetical protein
MVVIAESRMQKEDWLRHLRAVLSDALKNKGIL